MPTRKLKISDQALAAFSDAGRAAHLRSMDGGTRARHKPRFRSTVPFMLTSFIPRATGQKLKVRFLAGTRDQSMLSHPWRKSKHTEKRNTKIKNGNGVDSEPLAPWCDLLKSCTGVWSLNDTTALLPVNSVTLCVKFIWKKYHLIKSKNRVYSIFHSR